MIHAAEREESSTLLTDIHIRTYESHIKTAVLEGLQPFAPNNQAYDLTPAECEIKDNNPATMYDCRLASSSPGLYHFLITQIVLRFISMHNVINSFISFHCITVLSEVIAS